MWGLSFYLCGVWFLYWFELCICFLLGESQYGIDSLLCRKLLINIYFHIKLSFPTNVSRNPLSGRIHFWKWVNAEASIPSFRSMFIYFINNKGLVDKALSVLYEPSFTTLHIHRLRNCMCWLLQYGNEKSFIISQHPVTLYSFSLWHSYQK